MVIVPKPRKNEEKASIEGKAHNFSESQSLFRGAKVGIFPSPRAHIGGAKASGKMKKYEGICRKYEEM